MKQGIYIIRQVGTERCYVGSATDILKRWSYHRCRLRQGKHHSSFLQRAWSKHGENQFLFEIVEIVENRDDLKAREASWIRVMNCLSPHGFNMCPNTDSKRGYKVSEATKEKMRQAAIRVGADPAERERRRQRAIVQHQEGRFV